MKKAFFAAVCFYCALFSEIVPFRESLKEFKPQRNKIRESDLQYFEAAYNQNHYEKVTPSKEPRIPKLLHIIWLGSDLPSCFVPLVESWKQHHPDWQFKLWTDADIGSFPLVTEDAIHKVKNYGQKSDIFRYEILNRFGGLYVDTDFLCLKPHDIIHHTCDFYSGMNSQIVFNGNIGACPKHPIIQQCLRKIKTTSALSGGTRVIVNTTGPKLFTNAILNQLKKDPTGCIVYPTSYFYSFPTQLRRFYWRRKDLNIPYRHAKKESFATHLWAYSWTHTGSALKGNNPFSG